MSDTAQNRFASMRIVYAVPGMDAVTVQRDETYRVKEGHALTLDMYYPPDAPSGARLPAVIFVTGFSDAGAQRMLGCRFKEMGSYVSWAQLVAASGISTCAIMPRSCGSTRAGSRCRPVQGMCRTRCPC